VPDFSLHNIPKRGKLPLKYQMVIKYLNSPYYIPNGHTIHQPFSIQGPPKFTQIGIFGLKIYHLATLTDQTNGNSTMPLKALQTRLAW
jgi:hypothetical protein